jgi:hypothetical protein
MSQTTTQAIPSIPSGYCQTICPNRHRWSFFIYKLQCTIIEAIYSILQNRFIRVYRYVMNSASATLKVVIIILEKYSVKKLYFLILSLVRSTEDKFVTFITKMYATQQICILISLSLIGLLYASELSRFVIFMPQINLR